MLSNKNKLNPRTDTFFLRLVLVLSFFNGNSKPSLKSNVDIANSELVYYFQSNDFESKFTLNLQSEISLWKEVQDLMPKSGFSTNFERSTAYTRRIVIQDFRDSMVYANYNPIWAEFYVSEKIQEFNWEILDSTSVVLDKKCNIAKTSFRGRNYYAHFSPEIPLSLGPWKFGGLPGMILRVENDDENDYFLMECIQIKTTSESVDTEKFLKKFKRKHKKRFMSWNAFVADFEQYIAKTIKFWKTQHEEGEEGLFSFKLVNFLEIFHPCQIEAVKY